MIQAIVILVIAALVAVDQVIKLVVVNNLSDGGYVEALFGLLRFAVYEEIARDHHEHIRSETSAYLQKAQKTVVKGDGRGRRQLKAPVVGEVACHYHHHAYYPQQLDGAVSLFNSRHGISSFSLIIPQRTVAKKDSFLYICTI